MPPLAVPCSQPSSPISSGQLGDADELYTHFQVPALGLRPVAVIRFTSPVTLTGPKTRRSFPTPHLRHDQLSTVWLQLQTALAGTNKKYQRNY